MRLLVPWNEFVALIVRTLRAKLLAPGLSWLKTFVE